MIGLGVVVVVQTIDGQTSTVNRSVSSLTVSPLTLLT